MVTYLDLYAGFKNTFYVLFEDEELISNPIALEVVNSETIYYVNNVNGDEVGTLNKVQTTAESDPEILASKALRGYALAYSIEKRLFYSLGDGSVWTYELDSENSKMSYSDFKKPTGMCYADGVVYVSDFEMGTIYSLSDKEGAQTPGELIEIQGSYAVFCVNEYSWVALAALSLFLIF